MGRPRVSPLRMWPHGPLHVLLELLQPQIRAALPGMQGKGYAEPGVEVLMSATSSREHLHTFRSVAHWAATGSPAITKAASKCGTVGNAGVSYPLGPSDLCTRGEFPCQSSYLVVRAPQRLTARVLLLRPDLGSVPVWLFWTWSVLL